MFERFTHPAREAVVHAQEEVRRQQGERLGTEHLLLGVLADTDNTAAAALRRLGLTPAATRRRIAELAGPDTGLDAEALRSIGIDLDAVRRQAEAAFGPGALNRHCRGSRHRGFLPFSPRAKKVLELALREAAQLSDRSIGTEHLLLGVLREGQGVAVQVLAALDVEPGRLRSTVLRLREQQPPSLTVEGRLDAIDSTLQQVLRQQDAIMRAVNRLVDPPPEGT